MKKLKQLYIEYLNGGCNRINAIEEAVRKLYPNKHIYIHLDNWEDFSHVFIENEVLFSDGSIYTQNAAKEN